MVDNLRSSVQKKRSHSLNDRRTWTIFFLFKFLNILKKKSIHCIFFEIAYKFTYVKLFLLFVYCWYIVSISWIFMWPRLKSRFLQWFEVLIETGEACLSTAICFQILTTLSIELWPLKGANSVQCQSSGREIHLLYISCSKEQTTNPDERTLDFCFDRLINGRERGSIRTYSVGFPTCVSNLWKFYIEFWSLLCLLFSLCRTGHPRYGKCLLCHDVV